MDKLTMNNADILEVWYLDEFTTAYIECALWSSTDNSTESGGYPLDDNYGPEDIHPDCLAEMVKDCRNFQEECADLLDGLDDGQSGHDFWLTRNGHGAGFWDRGLGKLGDELTKRCEPYGSFDLMVGSDGKIHC